MTADAVAGTLRSSRNLEGYRIEIQASGGLVTLTGALGNPAQKAEVLDRARHVAGVSGVIDQLQVSNDTQSARSSINPTRALAQHGRRRHVGGDIELSMAGTSDRSSPGTAGGDRSVPAAPYPKVPQG